MSRTKIDLEAIDVVGKINNHVMFLVAVILASNVHIFLLLQPGPTTCGLCACRAYHSLLHIQNISTNKHNNALCSLGPVKTGCNQV